MVVVTENFSKLVFQCDPVEFREMKLGQKRFFVVADDERFKVGEEITLFEFDFFKGVFTGDGFKGRIVFKEIANVTGLANGYCILQLTNNLIEELLHPFAKRATCLDQSEG